MKVDAGHSAGRRYPPRTRSAMLFAVFVASSCRPRAPHQTDSFAVSTWARPIPIAAAMSGVVASGVALGHSAPEIPNIGLSR